jgi:hypothetical protein
MPWAISVRGTHRPQTREHLLQRMPSDRSMGLAPCARTNWKIGATPYDIDFGKCDRAYKLTLGGNGSRVSPLSSRSQIT